MGTLEIDVVQLSGNNRQRILPVATFELFKPPLFVHALSSSRLLQQLRKLATLGLQIRVPTNVLVVDEDIRDGALLGHFLERVLDRCSVICFRQPSAIKIPQATPHPGPRTSEDKAGSNIPT